MAFIRVEPVQVKVRTDWFNGQPREITWGDERLPITRSRGRPRRGGRLPCHQRPTNALRGGHASRPAVTDLSAPLAPLDGDRPRRGGPSPGGLIANTHRCPGLGSRASAPRRTLPPHVGHVGQRGGRAGTAPAPSPTRCAGRRCVRCRHLTPSATVQSARWTSRPVPLSRPVASTVHRGAGSAAPVPGGGSASAVAPRSAPALVEMVAHSRWDAREYAEHADLHAWANETGSRLADVFLMLADEDAEAYAGFAAAMKMPRDTDDEKAIRADGSPGRGPRGGRGPAPLRRGLRGSRRGRRSAGGPEQCQRLERPQRRLPSRRGGRPWRRGQRPGQPALGRRPRIRGDDDRRVDTYSTGRAPRIGDERGRRQGRPREPIPPSTRRDHAVAARRATSRRRADRR